MKNAILGLLSLICLTGMAFVNSGTALASSMEKLKIAVLCDDTLCSDKCLAEHGVAIFLELPNGHHWLFDTGTTDVFLLNAERMGLNLDNLTGIAISHLMTIIPAAWLFISASRGNPPFMDILTSGPNSMRLKKTNRSGFAACRIWPENTRRRIFIRCTM
jgi:hypothetical protein